MNEESPLSGLFFLFFFPLVIVCVVNYPMRELHFLHSLIIFLKLSVMPETQQEARAIMHFHLHSLIRWELDVVITCLFMRRDRAEKGNDLLVAPFHPDINITRSPGIRMQNRKKSKKI